MGFQDYLTSLGDNPYFGAGAGLFGVGVLTQAARKGGVILTTVLRRKYVLTMEVPRSAKNGEKDDVVVNARWRVDVHKINLHITARIKVTSGC